MTSKHLSLADEGFRPANAIDLSLDRQRQGPPIPKAPELGLPDRIHSLPKTLVFDKIRGGFWACVHQRPLPQLSDPRYPADPRLYIPGHLQNTYPWDAFYPTKGFSDDRLFGRLLMSRSQLSDSMMQDELGQWILLPKIRRSWQSLEKKLSQVIDAIQAADTMPTPPLNVPVWPSKKGYALLHGSKNRAVDAALRSITAFGEVCSFAAFCFSRWKTASETSPFEPIVIHLVSRTNVGHAWIDDLLKSPVGLISPEGRTGAMVDLLSTPWYRNLHVWAEYGVPLWIWLTEDPQSNFQNSDLDSTILKSWLPPPETLQKAFDESLPLTTLPQRSLHQATRIILSEWERRALLADQWVGETSEEFFDRMGHTIAQMEHAQAPRHPEPPQAWEDVHETSGIRYYHWRSTEQPSLRYRILDISRARILFAAHAPSQRFFNPYENSIDLQWTLDRSMGPTIFDAAFLETSISLSYEQYQQTLPHTETSHLYERGYRSDLSEMSVSDDQSDDSDGDDIYLDIFPSRATMPSQPAPVPRVCAADYLTTVLQKRLGYLQASTSQASSTTNVKEIVVHNVLGSNTDDQIPATFFHSTSDIINSLPKSVQLSSLSNRWDISPSSATPLEWRGSPLRIKSGTMADGAQRHRRYIIGIPTTPLREQWFVVVLYSATSVLQILRFGWAGILEIVRQLTRRSIKFNTAKYLARGEATPQVPKVERIGLGVRYEDSNWAEEYRQYERVRDDFLRGPRGQVAVMMGGVIGRLARDVVNIKDVTKPPLSSSRRHGAVVAIESELSLFGDALTDVEIDIVIGTYRMRRKKKRSPGDQLEYLAQWWPSPTTWENSGLAIGEWSPRCEEWYQKHLEKIRLGRAGPKPRAKWHNDLRLSRETRNVWLGYEALAAEFLDKHLSPI